MQNEYPAPKGFIGLIERKYNLKVIDSHYILVNEKFQQYHMMLDVQFNPKMEQIFREIYGKKESDMYVDWEFRPNTHSIRFLAEKGNNILLLWDKLLENR